MADRLADELVNGLDRRQYVGSLHHIVPRFVLKRFAVAAEQVYVRDRVAGADGRRNIKNLGVKDFYTFIDQQGELDSSHESILGFVETDAANILSELVDNPFRRPRPFTDDERTVIDTLVAMQAVRGHDQRRTGEVLTDYYMKFTNRDRLTAQELEEYEFVPHQNDLLNEAMQKAELIHRYLADRACGLVRLDRPLLITCDEPVLLLTDEDEEGSGEPDRPTAKRPPSESVGAHLPEDVILIAGTNLAGIARTDFIAMPLGPQLALLYLGPGSGEGSWDPFTLDGEDADEFAAAVVARAIENSCAWVVANPDHPTIATMQLPPTRNPLEFSDGGTAMSGRYATDSRRTARRLDKKAQPIKPGQK
ncbi:DUF4238 domain-containing protein [Nocardioides acrostichi]|uniref:DUF4238 domain-containing protein n=1 Tax=Nocardioides acrostichi TaxID=2784339 RepID=A0A930Y6L6_9ACTN|nr:DUF4238 domain-containing protein [Nocardioides acrostichi]MBF4162500.1 DUF4238 domain-containing protein [Nocardioides acrostichi]